MLPGNCFVFHFLLQVILQLTVKRTRSLRTLFIKIILLDVKYRNQWIPGAQDSNEDFGLTRLICKKNYQAISLFKWSSYVMLCYSHL